MARQDDDTPITNDDGSMNLEDMRQEERDQLGLDSLEDDDSM